jgi:hypothetical protein
MPVVALRHGLLFGIASGVVGAGDGCDRDTVLARAAAAAFAAPTRAIANCSGFIQLNLAFAAASCAIAIAAGLIPVELR